jgi:hypothetical protein
MCYSCVPLRKQGFVFVGENCPRAILTPNLSTIHSFSHSCAITNYLLVFGFPDAALLTFVVFLAGRTTLLSFSSLLYAWRCCYADCGFILLYH